MTTTPEKNAFVDGAIGRSQSGVSVLLADREVIFRTGLRNVLSQRCGFDVIAEADSGPDVTRMIRSCAPQILLLEMGLARSVGLSADRLGQMLERPPKLVLFGEEPDAEGLAEALQAGACGFVTRTLDARLLDAVLRHVLAGGCAIGDEVFDGLLISGRRKASPRFAHHHRRIALLNESERQVLQLLGHGLENSQIAEELHLSRASVKTYVSRLLNKLHLENRTQAALVANETGLVDHVGARK
ncbi:response regulator transcription factor [Streptomyces noursei]